MAREKAPLPNAAPADDKKRAIDTAMAQIERMYGKGSIMRFGDKAELNVDYIPTGSLSLDVALGIGGLPKGRIGGNRFAYFEFHRSGVHQLVPFRLLECERVVYQVVYSVAVYPSRA